MAFINLNCGLYENLLNLFKIEKYNVCVVSPSDLSLYVTFESVHENNGRDVGSYPR